MAFSKGLLVVPLVLAIVSFALAMVALMAGSRPGQMEDYHIIALNMSNFGHDLVPTPTTGGSQPTTTDQGGLGGFFSSVVATIESSIINELNDIEDDIADELSAKLGISQWYSLHIMDACEGNFAPNATTPGAWYNTTNCTAQQAGFQFNLSEILDREIDLGPLKLSASDLPVPSDITDAVDEINRGMLAIFVFYVLGIAFSGLSFLGCIAAFGMNSNSRLVPLVNTVIAGIASSTLGVGSAITTALAKKGEQEINEKGHDVGISAEAGVKFMIISWVAFGASSVAVLFWMASAFVGRRTKRNSHYPDSEKPIRQSTSVESGRPRAHGVRFFSGRRGTQGR